MIISRIITRGLYPLGHGRGLLTRGLKALPNMHSHNGHETTKVDRSVVAVLDGMSGWETPASDGTVVDLYTTLSAGGLVTPHMVNLLGQASQRRTGHGAKIDDVVRVRWTKIDGTGEDEVVFAWH